MPQTDSLDEVNQYIVDLMVTNKGTLGLQDVWYGEHTTIPHTPSMTVDPQSKRSTVQETGHMFRNDFAVALTLFHSRLGSGQVLMKECLALAEQVEGVLDADKKLGGLVIYGYVDSIETGYATRNKVIMKASLITWTGFSKTRKL